MFPRIPIRRRLHILANPKKFIWIQSILRVEGKIIRFQSDPENLLYCKRTLQTLQSALQIRKTLKTTTITLQMKKIYLECK